MPSSERSVAAPPPRNAGHRSGPVRARSAHAPDRTPVRYDLQGLRGVAVLGVVIYHLRASWLPGGFAGVDVFFVLSGFFITGLLLREVRATGTVDLVAFWGRRARRLLPASLLVLLVTVVAGLALTNPLEAHRIGRDGLFASVFAMNWHEAASGLAYGQDPDPSPFQHYWSLGVEEQFYLAWPLLLVVLALIWRRRRGLAPGQTLAAIAVPVGIASFLLAFHQTVGDQPYAYYGTFGRVWQLALGGLLAVVATSVADLRAPWGALARISGFGVIAGFYLAAPSVTSYPGAWALLPTAGAALVVLSGTPRDRRDPVTWLLTSRPAQLGGQYSYSWYLWHWAPLVLLPIALGRPLRIRELGWCAIATFLLAVATYHLLEDPVRRNGWLARPRRGRSLRLGLVLVVVGLAAAQVTVTVANHQANHTHVVTGEHAALTPQPAVAAHEQPQVVKDGCQLSITSTALAPKCRYLPDTGHGEVVLVGDSHAGMWFPAVREAAVRNRWGLRVWARESCPLAEVQKTVSAGGEYHACDTWRADVIARLVAEKPGLVIVASFAQTPLHVNESNGHGATQPRAHTLFEAGMERDLRTLRAAGIRVLVIGDVPAFSQAAPDCALAHADDLAACSLPQSQALPYGSVDVRAGRAVPGVAVVSVNSAFCHSGRCYQINDSILSYRDVNHITNEMALHLEPQIERAARAAISRR